jgi:hypothetical protein
MKYNALLQRKGQFAPICTVLDLDFPDDMPKKEKERLAAIELIREGEIYVELEPIKEEKSRPNSYENRGENAQNR